MKEYGKKLSGKQPSESIEMITFFNELEKKYPHLKRIATHVKNEGRRSDRQIAIDRAEGLCKGFSDIVVAGSPTFLCELKSRSNRSRISKEQIEFISKASDNGAFACVAYGWEAAMEALEDWIEVSQAR